MATIELKPLKMVLVIIMLATLLGRIHSTNGTTNSKPHILLIVADDLGWNDVSWHNPDAVTPHLEELALGGVILNRSYVLPICTPTRSALLTGRYPFTIGRQRSTLRPSEPTGLTLNATLLPQALKKVGYTTHAVGKWHLGYCSWAYTPTYRGFDTFYGYYNGAENYFTHLRSNLQDPPCEDCPISSNHTGDELFGLDLRNNTKPDPDKEGIYSSYLFASYVEDLLESRNPKDPMFLYLPFQSVHAPLMVPANYTKPYKHIHDFNRRTYLGMVTALDEAVGRVVQALKTTGHYNNSVIVFTTDNGGTCRHGGNNWPLRGMKATLWEGGTRGVAFVHSPLLPNPGTVSNKLLHATDWFQTLTGLGGGVAPADTDGFNQWEAITSSSPSPRKRMVYNIDQTLKIRAGVRIGNYKLLVGSPGEGDWTPPPELLKQKGEEEEEEALETASSLSTKKSGLGFSEQHPIQNEVLQNHISNAFDVTLYDRTSNHSETHLNRPTSNVSATHSITHEFQSFSLNSKGNHKTEAKEKVKPHKDYMYSKAKSMGPFVLNAYVPVQNEYPTQGKSASGSASDMMNRDITIDESPLTEIKETINGVKSSPLHFTDHRKNRVNSTGYNDGVSWEYLLKNYLVNDTWLNELPPSMQFLKNKTDIRLYNVKDDPEERNNLATKKMHVVKGLLEFLLQEMVNRYVPADIKPEVPAANPKYWNNTWSPGWCNAN